MLEQQEVALRQQEALGKLESERLTEKALEKVQRGPQGLPVTLPAWGPMPMAQVVPPLPPTITFVKAALP